MKDPVIQKTATQPPPEQWTPTPTTPEPDRSPEEEELERRGPSRQTIFIVAVVFAVAFAAAVIYGVRSRSDAQHDLKLATLRAAVPTVTVVHPTRGSKAQEVVLPGNTTAFIDTSIYARTNGYLKQWFVDIGARVRAGELLAIIEAPEVDQQLQQGEADLKSAQANEQLAETTNVRWQALVAKHAVSVPPAPAAKLRARHRTLRRRHHRAQHRRRRSHQRRLGQRAA
jgi:multidrug efflux pump subunit AcrA (membrane-fusion protein)